MDSLPDNILKHILLLNLPNLKGWHVIKVCKRWRKLLSGRVKYRTPGLQHTIPGEFFMFPNPGPGLIDAYLRNGRLTYPFIYHPDKTKLWDVIISYGQITFCYKNNQLVDYEYTGSNTYRSRQYQNEKIINRRAVVKKCNGEIYNAVPCNCGECYYAEMAKPMNYQKHIKIIHTIRGLHVLILLKLAHLKNRPLASGTKVSYRKVLLSSKKCYIATLPWELLLYIFHLAYPLITGEKLRGRWINYCYASNIHAHEIS